MSSRPRASLKLAKEAITIEASANNFAMAERPLPPGVTLVECMVFSGTDKGASWGPGLAIVWKKMTRQRFYGKYVTTGSHAARSGAALAYLPTMK